MTIDFNSDGTATCLHSDEIPLQTIGKMTTRRASEVEFNDKTQEWEVWLHNRGWKNTMGGWSKQHKPLFSAQSRAECLAWERDNWERLI